MVGELPYTTTSVKSILQNALFLFIIGTYVAGWTLDKIKNYTYGMDYEAWSEDDKTVDAVIRNLEIIGEAASHLPLEIQEQFKDVPWQMMKGIRNILVHEYFAVDLEIFWETVTTDLPRLKKTTYKIIS